MLNQKIVSETYDLLAKLIQNACVNPPGNEVKSITTIKEFLSAKGIECEIFESAPNRANLVAKIIGTSSEPGHRLMFGPSHVDVVPVADPESWIEGPFSGKIDEEFIWGRGAMDMLFIVATQVQAFAQLHTEGFQPKGDLLLFIVADEERGGQLGTEWMLENHPDQIQTDYAVGEMGGGAMAEGKKFLIYGERGGSWTRLLFKGTTAHGSMPYGTDNAVLKVSKAALRLTNYCDTKIPITTEYLTYLADGLGVTGIKHFLLTHKFTLPMILKMMKKSDPKTAKILHSLSRMTMSPNIIHGGLKTNVIAASASLDVDIRTLPGQDHDYVVYHIKQALGDLADEVEITLITDEDSGILSYGTVSDAQSEFINTMNDVVNGLLPGSSLVPYIYPGSTDLRFLRERGVQAYGYSLLSPKTTLDDITGLIHGPNERIRKETVELSLNAYYNLAKKWNI